MKLAWLLCGCLQLPLLAQTAILRGVVTDSSGAAVAGAKISLTGPENKTQSSNARGGYIFDQITPGSYTVQASAPQLTLPQPIQTVVGPGSNVLNLQLNVAAVVQSVNVGADEPTALTTDSSSSASATVLQGADLQALSDDPEDLMTDLQALAGPSAGPGGGSIFIDGFSSGELPPKEAIREVRINQNPFSPEFDKLGLGRIEILTKPGADHWRGNFNYNYATDTWNARNPYSDVKAPLLLNEFENGFSGPLSKRSSLSMDANWNAVDNGAIVNAVTLDPQTLAPTQFFDISKTIQRRARIFPRVDFQVNERNTLSFRYDFIKGAINGAGIGSLDLLSRGYRSQFTVNMLQVTETAVLGNGTVNETRFQSYTNHLATTPRSSAPTISVLSSFTGGGTRNGNARDLATNFEFQNNTTMIRGAHTWRFGVRLRYQTEDSKSPYNFNGSFIFSGGLGPALGANNQPVLDSSGQPALVQLDSIEVYRRTLLFEQMQYTPAQIRALGGGASEFTIDAGQASVYGSRIDASPFVGDEWRILPNLTLYGGLRYEVQTNLSDYGSVAPRLSLAWAPGRAGSKQPKTVIRAGYGVFYDRFALSYTILAHRYGGQVQQQYLVQNPDFFPNVPPLASLTGLQSVQAINTVDPNLRSPYTLQAVVTLERQIRPGTTLAATYTNSRGVHLLRSLDVNAPLPNGTFPRGNSNPDLVISSDGIYRQNQLSVNVNSKLNNAFSLTGSYTFNRAFSDTDGYNSSPANAYNYAGEYGPAYTDVHHRATLGGTINAKWNVRLNPFVSLQSGAPFNIITGTDAFGTTLYNSRPGIATNPSKPGLIQTSYGLLDPNPTPDEVILTHNDGRGPGQFSLNLRVGKVIGLGPRRITSGGAAGEHRYGATISMSARNILNHTNPGPIFGNITSPLFGRANQMAGSLNGEGFSENANNRRLEMQIRFSF